MRHIVTNIWQILRQYSKPGRRELGKVRTAEMKNSNWLGV